MLKKLSFIALLIMLKACTWGSSSSSSEDSNLIVVNQSRTADAKTLDPQAQFDSQSGLFIDSLYDTLLGYHYLKRPYELEPVLLSKMPETSKDGKTLSFELRKGVYFNDDACFPSGKGRELVSDDILYTMKRFADINVNTLSWFLLRDVVEGLDEFREFSKKTKNIDYDKVNISGFKKLDNYRFEIQLKQKNPIALYSFAASSMSIVAKEAVDKYGRAFSRHPVGTGAFSLKKYLKKQTMTFVKNQRYFKTYPTVGEPGDKEKGLLKDAGKKLPLVDVVHLHYIPETQPEMLKFKSGELAWVALDRDNFESMAYFDKSGGIKLNKELSESFSLYTAPGLVTSYLAFNMKNDVVQDKNIRKAISHAIDFNKKIELLSNGRGVKLNTMVPPSIPGSEKDIGEYGAGFNLKKAKEYLEKAGYGPENELELTLTLSGTSNSHRNTFEFLRNELDVIGIKLIADYKTWPSYLSATERGDFQIAASAWIADYPDPENFYQLLYGPNKHSSRFDHPKYNELYEEMRFMENGPKRYEILKEMALILQDEQPVIFDNTPLVSGLVQNWVSNFKRNIMISYPFKYFTLKDQANKAL